MEGKFVGRWKGVVGCSWVSTCVFTGVAITPYKTTRGGTIFVFREGKGAICFELGTVFKLARSVTRSFVRVTGFTIKGNVLG